MSNTTANNLKILDTSVKTSPEFEGCIDLDVMIGTLNGYVKRLSEKPTQKNIDDINSKLDSLYVITIMCADNHMWLYAPLKIERATIEQSNIRRFKQVISSGIWQDKTGNMYHMKTHNQPKLPLHAQASAKTKSIINNPEVYHLIMSLSIISQHMINIANNLTNENKDAKEIVKDTGVFLKNDAIRNTNQLEMWINDNNPSEVKGLFQSLKIQPLSDVVNSTEINIVDSLK